MKRKHWFEFSKFMVIISWSALIVFIALNAALIWADKEPMNDVLVALIGGVCGGSNIGYFVQNTIRNCSLNKCGLRIDGNGCCSKIDDE